MASSHRKTLVVGLHVYNTLSKQGGEPIWLLLAEPDTYLQRYVEKHGSGVCSSRYRLSHQLCVPSPVITLPLSLTALPAHCLHHVLLALLLHVL